MTKEIKEKQVWEHAHGHRYIILSAGLMKIRNPGESRTNWVKAVTYYDPDDIEAGPFTRDEPTFRERFTFVADRY